MKLIKLITLLTVCVGITNAQQTPAKKQSKAIAIIGATTHIGNGEVISNSLVSFNKGIIESIALYTGSEDLSKMKVIDATGQHIYPGFIVANSTLGLIEIDAVRATDDDQEIGTWNPHIRSLIAYNAESKVVESMRPNGVLLAQVTPRGGRISGTSSVVQLDAWNWEDAVIKSDNGIHLNWPSILSRGRWRLGEDRGLKSNPKYSSQVAEIDSYFKGAKANSNTTEGLQNLPLAAMKGLFDSSKTLFIHVNTEKAIMDAVEFTKQQALTKVVIVGAYEAFKVADYLKENKIAVLLQRVHSRPNNDDNDYDLPFKMASLLVKAGITVGLETSGDMERMNSRNLPFYAGTTAAYGLTKEQALQLITLNTAKILGIDSNYGSLEVGKSATLFISKGDALDMRTNHLTNAFIDGRKISLETHQTELWKRYSKKYSHQ
jgi:imidazolonepropionase-like amidohydrolase|tara:strand:- start:2026 stop:3324 length:1299 start_codon:yes stop_codon:yes gene_type:complete